MFRVSFTVGPLATDEGAGLTVATAGLARALARTTAAEVTIFGRGSMDGLDRLLWKGAVIRARGQTGSRIRELDFGLESAIASAGPRIVHSHGLWLSHQWSAWRCAKRNRIARIVSIHGQLDGWARARSSAKKWLAWRLYQRSSLRSAACLHALHEGEVGAIRAAGLTNPVCVIPNGIDKPLSSSGAAPWATHWATDAKILLFLGRIAEQKGAVELVRAWGRIAAEKDIREKNWKLVLVGWSEEETQRKIAAEISRAAISDSILVLGAQGGDAKTRCFTNATAFVLPSRSEGLPMAVLEAWSHSLPVAMTAACNLPIGFAENAAVEIALGSDVLANDLRNYLRLSPEEMDEMGRRGKELTQKLFSWDRIAGQMLEVYAWCLGGDQMPNTIRLK